MANQIVYGDQARQAVDAAGSSASIEGRVKPLRAQVEDTTSEYNREKLQGQLVKLAGGVAILRVGAATETEMKEKKARVEDAMHATKAAVEKSIVPGGGVALLRASKVLRQLKLEGDEQVGVNIITRAIEEPMRWIATNACHEGLIVVQKVQGMKDEEGFNAQTETYENLAQAGMIDPAKVVRSARQHAASIASFAAHDRSGHHADSGTAPRRGDAGWRYRRWNVLRSSGAKHGEPLFNSHGGKPRPVARGISPAAGRFGS